jgi:superfamily II DNA or RNA helicase
MKQERLRDTLKSAPPFDLVVCDEAHRLTARREFLSNDLYRTQNYRFIEWLIQERIVKWELNGDGSPRSPRVILMSATPHQGDDLRFAYLLQLARPDKIDAENATQPGKALTDSLILEECMTRTAKKRAVDWTGKSIFHGHETKTIDIPLSDSEKTVLRRLSHYVQFEMVFKESKGEALVRALAMHTFQKIAASSWAALHASITSRIKKAGGDRLNEDMIEEAASLAEEFDFLGGEAERNALSDLLHSIARIEIDSKWAAFQNLIRPGGNFREVGDRILIFTQYRITQSWLAEKLSLAGEKVMQIHGGLSLDERKSQRVAFENEGTILISTEAGSEGANLHRQCHLMVNYDLPWNPMRLLQRIGRLDRYGQKNKVKVANLKASESWDAMISQKIEAKLATVQASMGLVADEDYKTMILGSIHDSISIPDIMKNCSWNTESNSLDEAIDEAVQEILKRKSSLDSLFLESLGMPENYGKGAPNISADGFRQVFAWSAANHGIILRETRTSDNRLLKGVFHFTLPEAFRGGLRPNRECHLVFDRDLFAHVRHTSLGRVRGQEIKPSLAGFGDAITDWFFRSALQANGESAFYTAQLTQPIEDKSAWWIVFAARWKGNGIWAGPDLVLIYALDAHGVVLREVNSDEAIRCLQTMSSTNIPQSEIKIPDLSMSHDKCREVLRNMVDPKIHGKTLSFQPLCLVALS